MTEYEVVDDYFNRIWNECILQLYFNPDYQDQNAVTLDVVRSKFDSILDVVQDLMAERDGLLDRIAQAKNALDG